MIYQSPPIIDQVRSMMASKVREKYKSHKASGSGGDSFESSMNAEIEKKMNEDIEKMTKEEMNKLYMIPESLDSYWPEFRTLELTLGGPVKEYNVSSKQLNAALEWGEIFSRVYQDTLEEQGIAGGYDLSLLSKERQEEFRQQLHSNLAKDPNKERIQELMDIIGLKVDRL